MSQATKVALVTGASNGIGKAIAVALAKEGYLVAINYKSDTEGAKSVLKECEKSSEGHTLYQADVSEEAEVSRMLADIKEKYNHLDVLVNNAGIFDEGDSTTNTDAFTNVFKNNFLSCVSVVKHSLPLMGTGKIINISSIHGRLGHGRPSASAYSAFKAALNNYTLNLAKEVAPKILVNAVAPGRVLTPMWGSLSKEQEKELGKAHLTQRMIQPEEVANAVMFIVGNDAMCGEILTIDGGMSLVPLQS